MSGTDTTPDIRVEKLQFYVRCTCTELQVMETSLQAPNACDRHGHHLFEWAERDTLLQRSCTPAHRTTPYCTVPHRTIPHRTIPCCTVPHCTAPHCTIPHHTTLHRLLPGRVLAAVWGSGMEMLTRLSLSLTSAPARQNKRESHKAIRHRLQGCTDAQPRAGTCPSPAAGWGSSSGIWGRLG